MAKRKGNYVAGSGRDSFEKKHGEKPVPFKLLLTESQHEFIKTRFQVNLHKYASAADTVRDLIQLAIECEERTGKELIVMYCYGLESLECENAGIFAGGT